MQDKRESVLSAKMPMPRMRAHTNRAMTPNIVHVHSLGVPQVRLEPHVLARPPRIRRHGILDLPFQSPIAQFLQIDFGLQVWVAFKLALRGLPQTQRVALEAVTHGAPTQVPRQRLKGAAQTANAGQCVGQRANLGDAGLLDLCKRMLQKLRGLAM